MVAASEQFRKGARLLRLISLVLAIPALFTTFFPQLRAVSQLWSISTVGLYLISAFSDYPLPSPRLREAENAAIAEMHVDPSVVKAYCGFRGLAMTISTNINGLYAMVIMMSFVLPAPCWAFVLATTLSAGYFVVRQTPALAATPAGKKVTEIMDKHGMEIILALERLQIAEPLVRALLRQIPWGMALPNVMAAGMIFVYRTAFIPLPAPMKNLGFAVKMQETMKQYLMVVSSFRQAVLAKYNH